jgi:hypothetical protein
MVAALASPCHRIRDAERPALIVAQRLRHQAAPTWIVFLSGRQA